MQGGTGNGHDPENGGMQHRAGTIQSLSGGAFTLSMMQTSQNISVATNSGTQFQGMGGMGGMSNGMIVMVDAGMQPDGSFMAQNVESFTVMAEARSEFVIPLPAPSWATSVNWVAGFPVRLVT